MNIALYVQRGKERIEELLQDRRDVFTGLCAILALLLGFSFGRYARPRGIDSAPANLVSLPSCIVASAANAAKQATEELGGGETGEGMVVGSRNGSKYHYPWCPGASQIKNENKITFESEVAAQNAGYSKAANCK